MPEAPTGKPLAPRRARGARACVAPLALVGLLACAATVAPTAARGYTPVATVIQDDAILLHSDDAGVKAALAQIKSLGIDRVRITAGWSVIAPQPDSPTPPHFDATDPGAYPTGNWANLDRAVRLADAAGLKTMIDIAFWAPRWATRDDPSTPDRPRTDIDARQYARFAQAVARRYSGTYIPPTPAAGQATPPPEPGSAGDLLQTLLGRSSRPAAAPAPAPAQSRLPAVDIFTIWNEPNHPGFVLPQWAQVDGRRVPRSPDIYRAMVRAAYPAIKAVAPTAKVLIGGTSSYGSSTPGRGGIPPLLFLRRLACVDDRLRPITTGDCANFKPLPGDGWSHHPYSLRTLPSATPRDRDDAPVANTPRLARLLRRLVAAGRVAPGVANLYMTEYGYETNPPDPKALFSPQEQPRLLAWAESIATRTPQVVMWPQFLLRDRPGDPAGPRMRPFGDWQTGLFYADGSQKPVVADFRTPTFARCVRTGRRRVVEIWGRVRGEDRRETATVESRLAGPTGHGGWVTQASMATPRRRTRGAARTIVALPGAAIRRYVAWRPREELRLRWTVAGSTDTSIVAVRASSC
ncbi:MAG: hypothetical protein JWN32_2882 [Solirubrobacterales bacterium]|nr:hypothetical protein [Solirubrobacterales bacterium]